MRDGSKRTKLTFSVSLCFHDPCGRLLEAFSVNLSGLDTTFFPSSLTRPRETKTPTIKAARTVKHHRVGAYRIMAWSGDHATTLEQARVISFSFVVISPCHLSTWPSPSSAPAAASAQASA